MMNRIVALSSVLVLGTVAAGVPSASAQLSLRGDLTVAVEALESQSGNVCFKLFAGSQGFPNDDDSAVLKQCVPIEEIPLTMTFDDLAFGNYALAVYHDANEDGVMNRNALGMPSEGYGFSNDAPATTGPAQFQDAMFLIAGSETTIQLTMRYPN
jgi:uncharacterized protein (DUF2141 family)